MANRLTVNSTSTGASDLSAKSGALIASEINLDDLAAPDATYANKPILDLDGVVNQIDSGYSHDVSDGKITYAFFEFNRALGLNNNPQLGQGKGYSPFTAEQRDAARDSIDLWDDLIAPTFVEVTPKVGAKTWAQNTADIWFANTTTGPAQAEAYYPGYTNSGARVAGDVWIADYRTYYDKKGNLEYRGNFTNGDWSIGGYGLSTIVHELGHAIGLSHPGAYNYDPKLNLTYANYAEYAQDSEQYSIMSYWDEYQTGANVMNWNTLTLAPVFDEEGNFLGLDTFLGEWANAQTPMLHDIYVAQQKYGADLTTRADDTTYGFNSTAGKDVYDFTVNDQPFLAIYDAGGTDTLDFSGFNASTVINLNDGQFSSAGQGGITVAKIVEGLDPIDQAIKIAYGFADYTTDAGWIPSQGLINYFVGIYQEANANAIEAEWGHAGVYAMQYDNIAIAYDTVIENAIGTGYRDIIVANEVDNVLTGNGGDDVFIFLDGDNADTITDFSAGDLIDLSAFGVSESDVTFGSEQIMIESIGLTIYTPGITLAAGSEGLYFG